MSDLKPVKISGQLFWTKWMILYVEFQTDTLAVLANVVLSPKEKLVIVKTGVRFNPALDES